MNYLLDTCVALWYFAGSSRIPPLIQEELTDPANLLAVSDASALEVVIKHTLGKLPLKQAPSSFWGELIHQHGMERLPIGPAEIFLWGDLPLLHRDPFDRLLIAQARQHDLCLVTPDPLIRQYDAHTWWL
jgi:PIN domain nuclease of toxin-antitoxin system